MFCSKCGGQIPDGGEFCAYCGSKIIANTAPIEILPTARVATASQKMDDAWKAEYTKRWKNAPPSGLFLAFAVVASLIMLFRVMLFQDILNMEDYLIGLSGEPSDLFLSVFVGILCYGNHAYCILMTVAIWWLYKQSGDNGSDAFDDKPYQLMQVAQYLIAGVYALVFFLVAIWIAGINNELVDYLAGEYGFYAFLGVAFLVAYHVVAIFMLNRVKRSRELSYAGGLDYASIMAVMHFVSAGVMVYLAVGQNEMLRLLSYATSSFADSSWLLILAYQMIAAFLLLHLNQWRNEMQIEYNNFLRKKEEANGTGKGKKEEKIPAWKRAQMLNYDN